MEKKSITKFPAGFFQLKRRTITASEALKDEIPFKWEKASKVKEKKKIILNVGDVVTNAIDEQLDGKDDG